MKRKENTIGSVLSIGWEALWSVAIGGRISRGQLWLADMFTRLWLTIIFVLDMAIFSMPIIVFVFLLAGIIKTIFLMVQRMNDLDFSGNWLLAALGLIIFCLIIQHIVTRIILIIFLIAFQIALYAISGTEGTNQFGADPLKTQPKENDKYFIIVFVLLVLILTLGAIVGFFLGGLEAIGIGGSN